MDELSVHHDLQLCLSLGFFTTPLGMDGRSEVSWRRAFSRGDNDREWDVGGFPPCRVY